MGETQKSGGKVKNILCVALSIVVICILARIAVFFFGDRYDKYDDYLDE